MNCFHRTSTGTRANNETAKMPDLRERGIRAYLQARFESAAKEDDGSNFGQRQSALASAEKGETSKVTAARTERNDEIVRRFGLGERPADLSREYGISRQRVTQIAKRLPREKLPRRAHRTAPKYKDASLG